VRAARLSFVALACAPLLVGVASADDKAHPTVFIAIDGCVSVDEVDVHKIVGIELGASVAEASSPEMTRVNATCKDKLVELKVDDPITGKSLNRVVDILAAAPKARARLLALAIVELVSASWTELETNPTPVVPPAGPKPKPEVKEAARDAVRTRVIPQPSPTALRLMAEVGRKMFFPRTGPTLGFGLRAGSDAWPIFGWTADMHADHASVPASLGSVAVDTVSIGGAFVAHQSWSALALRGGLGFRGGIARLTGEPNDPDAVRASTLNAPWGGPMAVAGVGIRPITMLSIELVAEAGYVILPVRAKVAAEREAGVDGAWIGATLAIGLAL